MFAREKWKKPSSKVAHKSDFMYWPGGLKGPFWAEIGI